MIIDIMKNQQLTLKLGRQGENDATVITFDLTGLKEEFGEGILALLMQRSGDANPFPVTIETSGNSAVWTISNVETSIPGIGRAQITYIVDNVIKKTVIYNTLVEPSLVSESETPPDPYNSWLDTLTQIGGQIVIDKAEALDDIADAKTGALNDISSAKTSTLSDISTARTETISAVQAETSRAQEYADDASRYKEEAEEARWLAQEYADQARSYAEGLHFDESTSGNIVIHIGD